MRRTKFTAGLLTFSLLLAASAIAGNTNKGTLQLTDTVTVGGKQLPAGKYRVEWAGSGATVEVSISALTEIFFGGKKYQLSIGEASAATATPSDKAQGRN